MLQIHATKLRSQHSGMEERLESSFTFNSLMLPNSLIKTSRMTRMCN